MTELILVRHGQSMGNLHRQFLGHTDYDLSETGYEQAKRLAAFLRDTQIDAVYSSDLLRARHTAEPIAQARELKIHLEPELREIQAGLWEGQTFPYLEEHFPESYHTFRSDLGNARPDGGESTEEVRERMYACVKRIATAEEGHRVLLASHATSICMFACAALGLAREQVRNLGLPTNASVSVFEWRGGRFALRRYSEDAYLGELRLKAPPLA